MPNDCTQYLAPTELRAMPYWNRPDPLNSEPGALNPANVMALGVQDLGQWPYGASPTQARPNAAVPRQLEGVLRPFMPAGGGCNRLTSLKKAQAEQAFLNTLGTRAAKRSAMTDLSHPRAAYDQLDEPTELPLGPTGLRWAKLLTTGRVVPRGLLCLANLTFAYVDRQAAMPGGADAAAQQRILARNDPATTQRNWNLTTQFIGGFPPARRELMEPQINQNVHDFVNVASIGGINLASCIWRQVMIYRKCFRSLGGDLLTRAGAGGARAASAMALPSAAFLVQCTNVVDWGWSSAVALPLVADKHTEDISLGRTFTWASIEVQFRIEAYCLVQQRIVDRLEWGYAYENFDPAAAPATPQGRLMDAFDGQPLMTPRLIVWIGNGRPDASAVRGRAAGVFFRDPTVM